MKMRQWHWFASLFLLLIFLGSKSVEYHAVSHMDGDTTACEWCDFALLLHTTPFEPAPETTPEIPHVVPITGQPEYAYRQVLVSKDFYYRNFSRPPPHLS
jgi:hypothetical protein